MSAPTPAPARGRPGPATPAVLVDRPRLGGLLDPASAAVTTVVAPAGYGKSTLVGQWLGGHRLRSWRSATVAAGPGDHDPTRFWRRLGDAVGAVGADLPAGAGHLLRDETRSAAGRPPDAYLQALVQALEAATHRVVLVLDDLQALPGAVVREGLRALLAELPDTVHTVLVSRAAVDDMGLHRLRASGRLREVTTRDLAFDDGEAAELLARLSGVRLAAPDLAVLLARGDGWVTGLRLAAYALRDAPDPGAYCRGFAGHGRHVAEFLLDEVLDRLPAERREFLLDVAVLDELSGPACDAVRARPGSLATLRDLERDGVFVTALDEGRRRFRFLPLFRDLLRDQLDLCPDGRAARQHTRASAHCAAAGQPSAAVEHALLAGDHPRASALMVPLVATLHRDGLDGTLQRWFAAVPDALLAATPRLAVKKAWICAYGGDPRGALEWCERAEAAEGAEAAEAAEAAEGAEAAPAADPAGGATAAESACLRAIAHHMLGDPGAAVACGTAALERLAAARDPRADDYARFAMVDAVAAAYGELGCPEPGVELLRAHLDRLPGAATAFAAVGLPATLAGLSSLLGELDEAKRHAERALAEADRVGLDGRAPVAEAHVALGEWHWEHDQPGRGAAAFERALDASGSSRTVWVRARALLGLAKCRSALRRFAEADLVLDTVARVSPWGPPPPFLRAQLVEHRLLTAARRGDDLTARERLDELAALPAASARLAYLEAVVLLAERRWDELGERRRAVDDAALSPRAAVEWAVLDLRRAAAQGDAVTEALLRVLERGAAGGFLRTVMGPDAAVVARALKALPARLRDGSGVPPHYLRLLDEAVRGELGKADDEPEPLPRESVDEPFTEGELGVIRLLSTDLTYAEIADRRHVSVNTVKTQLKSVYRKLGVRTRAGAAERCRRLGLVP